MGERRQGIIKMNKKYKGFNEKLTKKDLTKEELKCYNKLMEGINEASIKEKDDIAHLMEIYIETDEGIFTNCNRCGKKFKNKFKGDTEINKRIYCDDCISKMWSSIK